MGTDIFGDLRAKLPELKAEHARLGQLIALLDDGEPATPGASVVAVGAVKSAPRSTKVEKDEFVDMSAAEAIKAFLGIMGKGNPQGPREMARALIAGGRGDTDEEKAYVNVTSSLKRLNKNGEVRQVRRGQWGLASWYGAQSQKKGNGDE